jgi:hypothetical protein
MTRGKVVTVAEDGPERLGDRTNSRLAPGQVLVDVKILKRAVQPLRPRRIGVAVGDEGAVFKRERLGHGFEPIERVDLVAPAGRFSA